MVSIFADNKMTYNYSLLNIYVQIPDSSRNDALA